MVIFISYGNIIICTVSVVHILVLCLHLCTLPTSLYFTHILVLCPYPVSLSLYLYPTQFIRKITKAANTIVPSPHPCTFPIPLYLTLILVPCSHHVPIPLILFLCHYIDFFLLLSLAFLIYIRNNCRITLYVCTYPY